jgi:hypothetical protein
LQSASSPLITSASIVESIKRDRSRLSSIAADDLDALAEGAGYSVGEDQDRTIQGLAGQDANSKTATYPTESEAAAQQEEDAISTNILEDV